MDTAPLPGTSTASSSRPSQEVNDGEVCAVSTNTRHATLVFISIFTVESQKNVGCVIQKIRRKRSVLKECRRNDIVPDRWMVVLSSFRRLEFKNGFCGMRQAFDDTTLNYIRLNETEKNIREGFLLDTRCVDLTDIIKASLAIDFPTDKVQIALRRKLEETGLPSFRLETCIEVVLQYMGEITRLGLLQSSTRNVEAKAHQGAMMQSTAPTTTAATTSTFSLSSSPLCSSSTNPSSQADPLACSSEEPLETSPISPTDDSQVDQVIDSLPTFSSTLSPSSGIVTPTTSIPRNAHPKLAFNATAVSSFQSHDFMTRPMEKLSISGKSLSSQELAAELKKIKDSRMCKVCMDSEMDMVFLPCSHMVTCSSCALALTQCPICRSDIKYAIKPIIS